MNDLAMTCSDFVNVLKNTLFIELAMATLKKVVIDRWAAM